MEKGNYKDVTIENIDYLREKLEKQECKKSSLLEISIILVERKKAIKSFVKILFENLKNHNWNSNKINNSEWHINFLV